MSLSAGTRRGPYEILFAIGKGGMGEVYRARDTRLDRDVAIKVLPEAFAADPDRRRRFEHEARAIASLIHPNICQIHDGGAGYLVLELIDGEPLRGPMAVEHALRLAGQIAGALDVAHRRGILHRDLKPANIMVTRDGTAKLLDVNLALMARPGEVPGDVTRTVEGTVVGTAAYMSPEQPEGKALDARSDTFSFGAVLYEMCSGTRAFERRGPTRSWAARPQTQVNRSFGPSSGSCPLTSCSRPGAVHARAKRNDVRPGPCPAPLTGQIALEIEVKRERASFRTGTMNGDGRGRAQGLDVPRREHRQHA